MNHYSWRGMVFTLPGPVLIYVGPDIGGAQFMRVRPPKNPGCPIWGVACPMPDLVGTLWVQQSSSIHIVTFDSSSTVTSPCTCIWGTCHLLWDNFFVLHSSCAPFTSPDHALRLPQATYSFLDCGPHQALCMRNLRMTMAGNWVYSTPLNSHLRIS